MTLRPQLREWANRLWLGSCRADHDRFAAALDHVEATQTQLLLDLVHRNRETEFGRRRRFDRIRSVRDYQSAVPLSHYEDYLDDIEKIASGRQHVLTSDKVLLFTPSSGSTAASKLIPYTVSLKREFQRAIAPWTVSLYRRHSGLMRGSVYWSLSPPGAAARQHGSVRVGFDSDAEYLGFLGRAAFNLVSAVPQEVASTASMDEFRRRTLAHLLADESLCFISIWSPTFLTTLLDFLMENLGQILSRLPGRRAEEVRSICGQTTGSPAWYAIWPRLKVISCWTHGASAEHARKLKAAFSGVTIQGKGLIATEAVVSLPFDEATNPLLAVTSHFFEFRNIRSGDVYLAHQLETDAIYSVIVTTGGGLYRYQLCDLVQVTGHVGKAPCFCFVGKENHVSDLFGEKLNEVHVKHSIESVLAELSLQPSFYLVAPSSNNGAGSRYVLFIQDEHLTADIATKLKTRVEQELLRNFHYAHCRKLGQLGALCISQIDQHVAPHEIYVNQMVSRGLKLGDIKPVVLDSKSVWEELFRSKDA